MLHSGTRYILLRTSYLLLLGLLLLVSSACTDAAPAATRLPPAGEPVRFSEVASEVGLNFQHGAFRWGLSGDAVAMMAGGLCWLDYDQDGWLDLFVVNNYAQAEAGRWEAEGGLPRSALFHNEQGRFTEVGEAAGAALPMRGNGCVAADLDVDGWTDLYLTTERNNLLLWNNGDGTFTEGAEAAGVDAYGWQTAAVVGDVNADGLPDLFTAGYVDLNHPLPDSAMGFPNSHTARRDLLYLNQGAESGQRPTFREVGSLVGFERQDHAYGLGAVFSDFDVDGDLDLYVANDTNPNRLYHNYGWYGGAENDPLGLGFRLIEEGAAAGVDDPNSGMGVASADYDLDGLADLFVTNLGQQLDAAYRGRPGSLHFDNVIDELGVSHYGVGTTGWGITWADFDLDGDPELLIANGNVPVLDPATDAQHLLLFDNLTAQGQTEVYADISSSSGLDQLGPFLARSSAAADYDNDGDVDVAISQTGGPLVLLRNETTTGNWLTVDLVGFHPGATVMAHLPDGKVLRCEVKAGSSYLASEDPRCHFGLGAFGEVAELLIRWPSGATQTIENVRANQILTVPDTDEHTE